MITLDGDKLKVESYRLYPIDDSIAGDRAIADEIEKLKKSVSAAVFASRGYSVDQPLAIIPQDLPNTFTDFAAGTLLANLTTDAFRSATKADIGFSVNGLMRSGLTRGKTGVQTVYDIFAVAPLGFGVVDTTAGSALVTGYFTGLDLKNLLEYWLVDSPAHPGEFLPRASGMRFRYDMSRPTVRRRDGHRTGRPRPRLPRDRHHRQGRRLYSLTCPLMLGVFIVAIPKSTKANWLLFPRTRRGSPSSPELRHSMRLAKTRVTCCRRRAPRTRAASPRGRGSAVSEIKEWQAIMDHLRSLPVKSAGELPVIPVDERAAEVRAIKAG